MNQIKSATKHLVGIVALGVVSLLITGCASQGEFRGQSTGTQISLAGNNYKVIKAGATGQSSGFRLLGISRSPARTTARPRPRFTNLSVSR